MKYVYRAIVWPSKFDGPEEDREIGIYDTQQKAENAVMDWVSRSRLPHGSRLCNCIWEFKVESIALNNTVRCF